jgi:hypothetical protein
VLSLQCQEWVVEFGAEDFDLEPPKNSSGKKIVNINMATLAAIHHDLSNKMSTSTLQQFVSNEVEQNTQSLLNSLSILDEQLQRVQHDSGIRARFYNDPVGDWKINDQPELLPPSASDLLHTKQDATLTYLEFAQRPRRNTNTNTNTNTTHHTHHKRRNTPPPPPPAPPPPLLSNSHYTSSTFGTTFGTMGTDQEMQALVTANNDLARALYLKERETLELREVEEENLVLKRMYNMEDEEAEFMAQQNEAAALQVAQRQQINNYSAALAQTSNPELDRRRANIQRKMRMNSGEEQYNKIANKIAVELETVNEFKQDRARRVSPSRPPTWAINPTKKNLATPLWQQKEAEDTISNVFSKSPKNLVTYSARQSVQKKKKNRGRKVSGRDGNLNVRGRFDNIEMSFGQGGDSESDDEELRDKYPTSRNRNDRAMGSKGGGGRSQGRESEDMRAYRRRLKEKGDRRGLLVGERKRAQEFWLS